MSEVSAGFALSVTFTIAMLLGPDVPPWQMRWARRPGITPPDTFGNLRIVTPSAEGGGNAESVWRVWKVEVGG